MTRSPAAVAVAIAVLMTASCGGKSSTKSAPPTTTVATTTTAPPATESAIATSVAPTVPPTLAPTTTTTLSPKELAEAEVRAAFKVFAELSIGCYVWPTECAPEEFGMEPELSAYRALIDRKYIALGRHAEPNLTDPPYTVIDGPIVFSDEGQTATFNVCKWNTNTLVQDEPRVVIDDLNVSNHENIVLRKRDGRWFVAGSGPAGSDVVGRNDCGPRP
jgi:hypothetical protein